MQDCIYETKILQLLPFGWKEIFFHNRLSNIRNSEMIRHYLTKNISHIAKILTKIYTPQPPHINQPTNKRKQMKTNEQKQK